jgi:hypothetical protein
VAEVLTREAHRCIRTNQLLFSFERINFLAIIYVPDDGNEVEGNEVEVVEIEEDDDVFE